VPGVDEQHDHIGGRGAGDGVAGVLDVARAVREDETPCRGSEIAVGDVDGDALLALGPQAVGEQCEVGPGEPTVTGYPLDRGELVGEAGSVQMAAPVQTLLDAALAQSAAYDADWRARYAEAYRQQNKDFLRFVATGDFPAIASDCRDGLAAAQVAEAGVRALKEGQRIAIPATPRPAFYAR
jgi:hypothetical protein